MPKIEIKDGLDNARIAPYIKDGFFDINSKDRSMTLKKPDGTIISNTLFIGAELDKNIQNIIFRISRWAAEAMDLINLSNVYVHLQGQGQEPFRTELTNIYYDTNYLYISWLIGNAVTQFTGFVDFALCIQNKHKESATSETIYWEYNTQPAEGFIVPTLHGQNDLAPIEDSSYEKIDNWDGITYTFPTIFPETPYRNVENTFYIDANNRLITVPEDFNFGIETDHGVKIIAVGFPKIIDGTDITTIAIEPYLTYTNANEETDRTKAIPNSTWTEIKDEIEYIGYYFIIPIGVTEYAGEVSFAFSFIYKTNGQINTAFNSEPAYAPVLATVAGGERLTVMTRDEFEAVLDSKMFDAMQRFFEENSIVFDGDVYS